MTLEIVENHVEVATFIFMVGGKLMFLFLMVVHHAGFFYLLTAALLNDVINIIVGFLSISPEYVWRESVHSQKPPPPPQLLVVCYSSRHSHLF